MDRTLGVSLALLLVACGGGGASGTDGTTPAGIAAITSYPALGEAGPNPVHTENQLPGSSGWELRIRSTQHQIEGYALTVSAAPGEAVPVAVSVTPGPAQFTWIVYRVGRYGGAGAREVLRGGPVTATTQPRCPIEVWTGLVGCGWKPTFSVQTGSDWVSGIYLIRLDRDDGWQTWVPLVVRFPTGAPAVVMIVPTATSQAYNEFQGESLYVDQNRITNRGRAFKVSHDRPYAMGFGAGNLVRWDQYVARWLESTGEDIGYLTDEDVDRDASLLAGAKVIVLSGHDEYWSGAVRDAMEGAVAGGTSLLLFGANAGYWQIRYERSSDGRERRVLTCYKEDAPRLDPVGASSPALTVKFRSAPVSRPENALFGVMYQEWNTFGFGMAIRRPEHWALAGTGLTAGDVLPLVGGYEVDAMVDNGAAPDGVEVLAEAPLLGLMGGMATGQMVVRQQGDAVVFAAGGIDFAAALDGDRGDVRVQRIAGNVLARALGRSASTNGVSFTPAVASGPFASSVTTVAGVAFDPGSADGGPGTGRLRQPVGVALLPGGAVAILDRGDRSLRRLDATGSLSTIAAPLPTSATPTGLAADAGGALYVSDPWNGTIVRVDASGASSTFATGLLGPTGLAIRGAGLYVVETGANAVRKIDLGSRAITTLASSLNRPTGVAVGADGTVYVIENASQRVVSLSGGQPVKVAGDAPGFADGPAAQARMLPHLGLAVLPDGSVVVADGGNGRVRLIRAGQVSTLAGSGRSGARDGRGDEAELVVPAGLAVDAAGRVYVADPAAATVRRITR